MYENNVDVIVDETAATAEEAIKAYNKYGVIAGGAIVAAAVCGVLYLAYDKVAKPRIAQFKENRADRKEEKLADKYVEVKIDDDAEVVE